MFLSLQGTVGYYLFGWRPQLVNLQWISLSWNRSIGLKFLSTRLRRNSRSSLCTNQGLAYRPVLQAITILNIKSGKVTFEKHNWKSSSALFYFLIPTVFGLILYLLIDTLFLPLWKLWPSFLKCNFWHVPILYPLDTFFWTHSENVSHLLPAHYSCCAASCDCNFGSAEAWAKVVQGSSHSGRERGAGVGRWSRLWPEGFLCLNIELSTLVLIT